MGPKPEWGENRVMRLANPARSWSPLLFPLNFVVKQRTYENGSETRAHICNSPLMLFQSLMVSNVQLSTGNMQ